MPKLFLRLSAVTLWIFTACRPEQGTARLSALYGAKPETVSLAACPSKDRSGQPVQEALPDEGLLELTNNGRVEGRLSLSIEGEDRRYFSLVPEQVPMTVPSFGKVQLPIRFHPEEARPHVATLTVDDGDDASSPLHVALNGIGRDSEPQPTLKLAAETGGSDPSNPSYADCFEGGTCMLDFGQVLFSQEARLRLRLSNAGCPALKITSATIQGSSAHFYLEEPVSLPSETLPAVLTSVGQADRATWVVRFSPLAEGEDDFNAQSAVLKLTTNDPAHATYYVQLLGTGVRPQLSVSPSLCDFSDSSMRCGFSTHIPNQAQFTVANTGTSPLKIESVRFEKGGLSGRFTVSRALSSTVIPVGGDDTLVVTHTDDATYVSDRLVVNGGSAGTIFVGLYGGTVPNLATEPADRLDYGAPTTSVTEKQVLIRNLSGGTLVLQNVRVDPSAYFSLVSGPPAGTRLTAGDSTTALVRYRKPVNGGQQVGAVRIESNDPRYAAPSHKLITLYSESPLDQPPVCVLTVCAPSELTSDPNCQSGSQVPRTINLTSIPLSSENKRVLTLSGINSSDPGPGGSVPVSQYEFTLLVKPPHAAGASLEYAGQRVTQPTVKLTLDNTATGEYRLSLRTYDDVGQASSYPAQLRLYVQ